MPDWPEEPISDEIVTVESRSDLPAAGPHESAVARWWDPPAVLWHSTHARTHEYAYTPMLIHAHSRSFTGVEEDGRLKGGGTSAVTRMESSALEDTVDVHETRFLHKASFGNAVHVMHHSISSAGPCYGCDPIITHTHARAQLAKFRYSCQNCSNGWTACKWPCTKEAAEAATTICSKFRDLQISCSCIRSDESCISDLISVIGILPFCPRN